MSVLPAADLPGFAGKPGADAFAAAWGVPPGAMRSAFREDETLRLDQIAGTAPANIAYPGEAASATIQLRNLGKTRLAVTGRWILVDYVLVTKSQDVFDLGLTRLGETVLGPVALDVEANGFIDLTVDIALPARCSTHALLLERTNGTRLFACSLARTLKPDLGPGERTYQVCMDLEAPAAITRLHTAPNRIGWPYHPTTDLRFSDHFEAMRKQLDGLKATGYPVCVEFGMGPKDGLHMPLGRTRPHLDADGVMQDTKKDMTWLPAFDADFKQVVKRVALEWGWPKGPINAMKFMNEPWNGISISGWGADDLRYREIYTALCEGVEEARAEGGVQVLLGGCDSSSNTFDKLFPDGDMSFLPRLDFMSLHYQGLSPSNARFMRDRQGPNGRVQFWDTESWVANSSDRVPGALSGMLAAGHDRIVGIFSKGVVASSARVDVRLADDKREWREQIQAWPVAPALAAFQQFIGNRPFAELVFGDALPWVFRFQGKSADDLTLVVCGDLSPALDSNNSVGIVPLRSVRGLAELKNKEVLRAQLAALPADSPERAGLQKRIEQPQILRDAGMSLAADARWNLYDDSGNAVPVRNGQLAMPLDGSGWYLRPDGSPGSGAALVAAVRAARIDGYEPLASVVRDALRPIGAGAVFAIELKNILNRPVAGKLQVTISGLQIEVPTEVAFLAHERKIVNAKVIGGAPNPRNQYALSLRFDAGADGVAEHDETVRVNLIGRRAITVDGDLSDWDGTLPQTVSAGGSGPTLMETAWLPMVKYDPALTTGFATAWMAADDSGFHFAAKIADNTPHAGMPRFATIDDSDCFYPETSYQVDRVKTRAARTAELRTDAGKKLALTPRVWEPVGSYMDLTLDLPGERLVSVYFIDDDLHLRRNAQVTVVDAAGKQVAKTEVKKREATWLRLRLSGKVRLTIGTELWKCSRVAAVAVDPLPKAVGNGPVLDEDVATRQNHAGVYGSELLLLPGKDPQGIIAAAWQDHIDSTPMTWPAGVRRFSYRMKPKLPQGPRFDNVQLAFNVLPDDRKPWYPMAPGTFKGFAGYWDTDYEFALNQIAPDFGGGYEVWPLRLPGKPDKHFYPRQLKYPGEGPVAETKLVVKRDGNTRIVEATLPWSTIPEVQSAYIAGLPFRFSFRVNDNAGNGCMELSRDRSVAKRNGSFKPDWVEHWSNEVEFGWEPKP